MGGALGWREEAGMHDLTFRFKRAHLSAVAYAKPLMKKWGLTPARFDLLYVVQQGGPYGVLQSTIWETLGLHRSTISKMCARLEQIGFIERFDAPEEPGHELLVKLTRENAVAITLAIKTLYRACAFQYAYRVMFASFAPDVDAFISTMRRGLERIGRALGDSSTLLYPIRYPRDASFEKVKKRLHLIIKTRLVAEAEEKRRQQNRAAYLAEQKEKSDKDYAEWEARAYADDGIDDGIDDDSYDH